MAIKNYQPYLLETADEIEAIFDAADAKRRLALKIPMDDGKHLVASVMPGEKDSEGNTILPSCINICVQRGTEVLQDVCEAAQQETGEIQCKIWADAESEDYTSQYNIPVWKGEE